MPPIEVYRVGELHFVSDGHHRVSVARQLGIEVIDASVTEVEHPGRRRRGARLADLPLKSHERLFFERVPLTPEERARITFSDPEQGLRAARRGRRGLGLPADAGARRAAATAARSREAWFQDEYEPVRRDAARGRPVGDGTETEAYIASPRALHAAAHPRLGRRGHRAPARALTGSVATLRVARRSARRSRGRRSAAGRVEPELDLLARLALLAASSRATIWLRCRSRRPPPPASAASSSTARTELLVASTSK